MEDKKSSVDLVIKKMAIGEKTKLGLLINVNKYEDFVKIIEEEENIADMIISANREIAIRLQFGIDAKNIIDTVAKPMKKAILNIRENVTRYMSEEGLAKLEGGAKNITFQARKETRGVQAHSQIKIGARYVDLKDVSKEDLVEELEKLGVKTRIRNEDVVAVKKEGIIVPK